jgi:hypothetical protein
VRITRLLTSRQTFTKRQTLGQVLICLGCCCGRVDRGRPHVPVDWLKAQWKQHRLHKSVQLTISGCLGPCDVANVVGVVTPHATVWLGGLASDAQYAALLAWAVQSARADRLLPLPEEFHAHVFDRFRPEARPLAMCAD